MKSINERRAKEDWRMRFAVRELFQTRLNFLYDVCAKLAL